MRVVGYIRVSTDREAEEGLGLDIQEGATVFLKCLIGKSRPRNLLGDRIAVLTPGGVMAAVLIARFPGDVAELTRAYDEAHQTIMGGGGAPGELRHHCAIDEEALYLIGVWESEEALRKRFFSSELEQILTSVGFPSPSNAEITILQLHAIEPPLTTP